MLMGLEKKEILSHLHISLMRSDDIGSETTTFAKVILSLELEPMYFFIGDLTMKILSFNSNEKIGDMKMK